MCLQCDKCHINKCYDRIDLSKENNPVKSIKSKECIASLY